MGLDNNTPSFLPPGVQVPVVGELPSMRGMIKDPDDPDNDWAARTSTINLVTGYIVMLSLTIFLMAAVGNTVRYDSDIPFTGEPMLLDSFITSLGIVFIGLVDIFGVVLFSLTIEADLPKQHSCVRRILRFSTIVVFFAINSIVWSFWGHSNSHDKLIGSVNTFRVWLPSASAAGFYILFAITYRVWGLFDIKNPALAS